MPKIIGNEEDEYLRTVQRDWFRTKAVDIAIGQLFLPGFAPFAESCESMNKLRLLVGTNSTRLDSAEIIDRHPKLQVVSEILDSERYSSQAQDRTRINMLLESVRRSLGAMSQTEKDEQLIKRMLQWLQSGKLDARAFTRERLDHNLILNLLMDGTESAVLGSTNVLFPTISGRQGIDLRFSGSQECSEFRDQFSNWWGNSQPINNVLIDELKHSWATYKCDPYHIYLLVLYHLVANRLETGEVPLDNDWLEGMPPLADFQQVAVNQALTILRQHNGVFVADVVGLGKTYIGSALLKRLAAQGQRATIFCPPSLVPMWQDFSSVYGLAAEVVSTGRLLNENGVNLSEPRYQTADRQVVLIDESHRFRNRGTDRYKILQDYSQGRKCILLTATPYSLHSRDVYSQIRLFADDDLDLGLNPPRLNEFFNEIEKQTESLVDVLRPLMIRRTRTHIRRHYANATIGIRQNDGTIIRQQLSFPKREVPTVVEYDVEGVYGVGLYDEIVSKLGRASECAPLQYSSNTKTKSEMTYARYGLYNYVWPEYKNREPYLDLKRAGSAVRGFIRVLLFKRLESSVQAFRDTIQSLLQGHNNYLTAIQSGQIPAGDQAQRILYDGSWDSDESLIEALRNLDKRYEPVAFDLYRLISDITNDRDILQEFATMLSVKTPDVDSKLRALLSLLDGPLKNEKVLIFSQFESTVKYLYENLKHFPNVEWLSGQQRVAGASFMRTVARFSPKSNPMFMSPTATPIRVLIATDVLSEGLNLQDCSTIVNYDIHWNPVRLIQRIGRVDRIGSAADSIRNYNFLPERNVEKVLKLEVKLKLRIAEIHQFIGEDNAILHPDEQLNTDELYAAYTTAPNEDESDGSGDSVDFTEIEEHIRQIQRDNPELIKEVLNMPGGARSAKLGKPGRRGTFMFMGTDDYDEMLIVDPVGKVGSNKLEHILTAIECGPDEPLYQLPPRHNATVSKSLKLFETQAAQRRTDKTHGPRLSVSQRYALKHLAPFLKSDANEDFKSTLQTVERSLRGRLPDAALKELNTIRRLGLVGDPLRSRLLQLYKDMDLARYADKQHEYDAPVMARIICSEALY